jgi:DNA-binding transcriptional MerR regulator
MNNRQIIRAYSIKEVAKMIHTPTGTIRQWEKELDGLLVIPRTQQGARYYTDHEIDILNKIKEMHNQNISKGKKRTLLEKYLQDEVEEPASKSSNEILVPPTLPSKKLEVLPVASKSELQTSYNMEAFYTALTGFKQDLLTEFKHELQMSKHDMVDEIKNEVSNSTLMTVKEISKSIQRSNDKQKANVHEISNMIMRASEHTSETFETLSEEIRKDSEGTYEKFAEQITETTKLAHRRNHKALEKVANTLKETKEDVAELSVALESKQKSILASINELKQTQEEIKKREEQFQSMIESYREVAASKRNRKWWKIWT